MTAKKHRDRIRRLSDGSAQAVLQALYLGGQEIELTAEQSITAGSISGAGHIPSAPGSPPSRDTGVLDGNIETEIKAQMPPTVTVTSKAPYSAYLEFGTSKMAARPFMRPATERNRDKITRSVRDAVNILIKRG